MTTRALATYSVVGGVLAVLIGCGGDAAPAPKSPAPDREESASTAAEPKTVQEAQDQIAQAVAELNGTASAGDSAKSTTPGTPPQAEPTVPGQTKKNADAAPDACATPCRALASMKRAVEALCRMTGEGDDKCVDARKTLATNVGKTSSCKCGI
jgi:hypothetical protein